MVTAAADARGKLEVRNLTLSYGENPVLRNVSFKVLNNDFLLKDEL